MAGVRFMRNLLSAIVLCALAPYPVSADEQYTDIIYTSVTMLYWCTHKEMPKNKSDISKVTNIDEPNEQITKEFDEWLGSISWKIDGEVLKIVRGSTTSISNCASVEVIEKKT